MRAKNARALAVPALASFGSTKTGSGTLRRALCGSGTRARCLQRFANLPASAGDPRSEHVATFIVRLTAPGGKRVINRNCRYVGFPARGVELTSGW